MLIKNIHPYYKIYYQTAKYQSAKDYYGFDFEKHGIMAGLDTENKNSAIENALQNVKSITDNIDAKAMESKDYLNNIRRYLVEYNRKFTLSVSCLVLFFIGAPLGAIIRKGGLGLPVVVSVVFFLIYHIISTIGEKMVKDGTLSPILGMWIAIFILTPLGLFLTYKATADSALFDIDAYKNLFKRFFKKKAITGK